MVFRPLVLELSIPDAPVLSVLVPESVTTLVEVNVKPPTLRLPVESVGWLVTVPNEAMSAVRLLAGAVFPIQFDPVVKAVPASLQTIVAPSTNRADATMRARPCSQ